MCRIPFILSLALWSTGALAQTGGFAIWHGDDRVGHVRVDRRSVGDRVVYAMTSHTEFTALWKRVIQTAVGSEYLAGRLVRCHSSLRVNDALQDSSHLDLRGAIPHAYVHPNRSTIAQCNNAWTTARMYYEEPVGQRAIYVESVLDDCPLVALGGGRYSLTLPGGKVNEYVYRNGVLMEVRVLRSFFTLEFKRV